MKASEVAAAVGATMQGGADPDLTGIAPLDRAGPSDLSFFSSARYADDAGTTRAGAVLVPPALAEHIPPTIVMLVTGDVYAALGTVLPRLYPPRPPEPGIHATAVIGADVQLGRDVTIGAFAVIGAGTRLGDRCHVGAHSVIGRDCVLGDAAYLHPQVSLYDGTRVGERSILHSGVRVGVDGFGYHFTAGGHRKIPQVGTCIIGSDVELGANTTIDRGSVGATEIGDGCKIDNLVHIGHNCRIGAHTVIIAQVGVAGSTRIGRGVTLAGQAGVNGHIRIGDGATIAGQAGVFGDVPAGATYSGYPARPHKEALRVQAAINRLPSLLRQLRGVKGGGEATTEP